MLRHGRGLSPYGTGNLSVWSATMGQMPFNEAQAVPLATYRLQLRREFPFADAGAQLPYLRQLGISHCYCSPILMSTPGSTHGYDVNDYRQIDSDLGGREGFESFAAAVKAHGMRILLDFVPNHMGINGGRNPWWIDVLECGPHSPYAEFFDIDWRDLHHASQPRVLVPILDDQYGVVLESGRFTIGYDGGEFALQYESMQFPVRPDTYAVLLEEAARGLEREGEVGTQLVGLAEAFRNLTTGRETDAGEPIGQRARDRLKRKLASLTETNGVALDAIEAELRSVNGAKGDPGSFDRLDEILNQQHYRLAHWKTGVHEVNYRRFFAIDSLIGLRMENPRVFEEAHRLVGGLIRAGLVHGLRIDHIDGLRNPLEYLERLQAFALKDGTRAAAPFYVVVEKILEDGERLDSAWPAHGTTGYEFIRQLNEIFVDPAAEPKFTRLYARFTGETGSFADVVHAEKRLVLEEMFANAVTQLGHQLAALVNEDRRWCNLTRHELTVAIREIMAGLGVYRIYRRMNAECRPEDAHEIEHAHAEALRRNPRRDPQPFAFVRDVLIGRYPPPSAAREYREALWRWVLTWQQYTGAVMAKSVEDTAFYVYNRFIALNEVGGNPGVFGGAVANFHLANRWRQSAMPHTLLATSTHDTKFGEDARARLYVLSELPDEWADWVGEWSELNCRHKTVIAGRPAPDPNEEYRFYQTLLGCWPPDLVEPDDAFRGRVREHMVKAVNEARRNTHWILPNEPWIQALGQFIDRILTPATGHEFLASFVPRMQRIAHLGMVNSLAQLVLKVTSPGVPDFYQGGERWNFSLVDPDNRQLIDWKEQGALATRARSESWRELLRRWRDGGIKLRLTEELLRYRNGHPDLFQRGDYQPIEAQGRFSSRLVLFRRRHGARETIVVVPRLTSRLGCPPLGLVWEDTRIDLPATADGWRDALTGRRLPAGSLLISELFQDLPAAVLHQHDPDGR